MSRLRPLGHSTVLLVRNTWWWEPSIHAFLIFPRLLSVGSSSQSVQWMYWTDWEEDPTESNRGKIKKAWMDGSHHQVFLTSKTVLWPNGLSLDISQGILYWVDAYYDRIEMVHLNTSTRKVVYEGQELNHAFGLCHYKQFLFWNEYRGGSIYKLDQASKTVTLLRNERPPIFEIRVYDAHQQQGTNACRLNNGGCSSLCLVIPDGRSCACADDQILDDDNVTCKDQHTCPADRFKCQNNRCIPVRWLCDGDNDCGNDEDESNTTCSGDVVIVQDLVVSTSAGAAVRNDEAETAAAAVVESTGASTQYRIPWEMSRLRPLGHSTVLLVRNTWWWEPSIHAFLIFPRLLSVGSSSQSVQRATQMVFLGPSSVQ
ncbi:hypothetical protein CRUP_036578 [Coryphaenoides rupestris]|nr:hypothetical protein CRUP_036578 [Coryphaenoides rupestris]